MHAATLVVTRDPLQPAAVTLRFDRPEKRNALREADMATLGEQLASIQHDATTKVVVLTGTGSAFTSGQDIGDLNAMPADRLARLFERDIDVLTRIVSMPQVVIAAVNGASAGLGNHLAACSDFCLVKSAAKFHFTGAAKSIPSPMLGTLLMPMIIGLKRAKALYLQGGVYEPAQALADGFCNAVVDEAGWDAALEKLVADFCACDGQVLAFNKHLLNQGVFDRLGALKLSGMAAAGLLGPATQLPAGRIDARPPAPGR